ncbi:hypothetical protein [Falsiroseomonas selenitidurans]|uniref:Transmembrane protein n=1 Tax=Falsiroseomonas selenitidurans TaxID=2716335 RepID=A0ABX1EA87_9PROT|nr:hypothetical protein [Falsiroseomonas selenitidurans]NKC32682.1 hypothetical protein [Falsiroseomonas selenitidurans]
MSEEAPLLERLRGLLAAEHVKLGVHIRKMNSPGSPVYRYWENIWPAGTILAASFAGTALVHFYLGGAILAAGCWWWLAKAHPRIRDGVFERTTAWALQSEAHFDALWAKGVLSLHAELPDGRKFAAARRDDWRGFVRLVSRETRLPEAA